MFNSIIFDKSAFESFNINEIFFLHQYYFPIVTHILTIEILADLKKEDNRDNQDRVQQLSHKILQLKPKYTMNYQQLIELELQGGTIEMSRRPIVGHGKNVISEDGKKGFFIDQPLEEKILQRWQERKFSEAEELSAAQWRISIEENLINVDKIESSERIQSLKNFHDILTYVDKYLTVPESQPKILENILSIYKVDPKVAANTFYKLETGQFLIVNKYAPYSCFCYRIFLVFSLALARGIITPRKTDIIDLQYLYYLPFSTIFTSDDKFHKMFAPLFIQEDQIFIPGFDLKNDLKAIVALRESQKVEDQKSWTLQHRQYPPEIKSSFTSELWEKHAPLNSRRSNESGRAKSSEENKKLIEMLNRIVDSPENPNYEGPFKDEDNDFVVLKSKVGPDDFCPCGSGKLFKDCHLPEVKRKQNT